MLALKCLSHTPLRGINDPGAEVEAEVAAALARARAEVEAYDPRTDRDLRARPL
jgi:2,3-dihydroxyphenylpropionate 1,2-dioxygenase